MTWDLFFHQKWPTLKSSSSQSKRLVVIKRASKNRPIPSSRLSNKPVLESSLMIETTKTQETSTVIGSREEFQLDLKLVKKTLKRMRSVAAREMMERRVR